MKKPQNLPETRKRFSYPMGILTANRTLTTWPFESYLSSEGFHV